MTIEWIHVSERLPTKELEHVLIAHKDGGVMEAEYHSRWVKSFPPDICLKECFEEKYFKTHTSEYELQGDYVEITHWMPMPKHPKHATPKQEAPLLC